MKLIIDIPKEAYNACLKLKSNDDEGVLGFCLINATANGTPLEEELENQKTGHWRFQKREGQECVYRCSNCGRKITKYDGFYDFERLFAYCPECGAKMEGE